MAALGKRGWMMHLQEGDTDFRLVTETRPWRRTSLDLVLVAVRAHSLSALGRF